jgi:exopolyphosphatase / guanosine-5'-triphosphate,3'-diphosphate pyrophosphatase
VKFGAIDIGSNGARMLISRILYEPMPDNPLLTRYFFKDIEYTRFPLRLGQDVFENQRISDKKKDQLLKLMQAFKLLMELYDVDDHLALATSAFREAENGKEVVKLVKERVGINIEVIDGAREAEILNLAIHNLLHDGTNYLHIDVGGGSTELNLYIGKKKFAARSFAMGSIRNVDSRKSIEILREMHRWLDNESHRFLPNQPKMAIGTGGNINKIFSLINPAGKTITAQEIQNLQQQLNRYSFSDKINLLQLNPDRADTIVPASTIYLSTMEWGGVETMLVPALGLKDGMMEVMLKRQLEKQAVKFG